MSAQSGWYPDPGGGDGLYRYWDGRAWSAATSPNPAAPAPAAALGSPVQPTQATGHHPYGEGMGQQGTGEQGAGQQGGQQPIYGRSAGYGNAYANYQATATKKKTPIGWWLGAGALLVVIVVVAVLVIRGTGGGDVVTPTGGEATSEVCPKEDSPTANPPQPGDGRVHGGPLSFPQLGAPWSVPRPEDRVPFGKDVATQSVTVEPQYAPKSDWVASILVGELQAGDGFFTPQQGAQIVVKCILGRFYGNNEVQSDVKVDQASKIDGHDAWIVESQLSFDIPNLKTKGELLLVAIVATSDTAGLYYASIPDTTPQLVQPARDSLKNLRVDG